MKKKIQYPTKTIVLIIIIVVSKYDGQQNLLVRTLLADGWTLLVFI